MDRRPVDGLDRVRCHPRLSHLAVTHLRQCFRRQGRGNIPLIKITVIEEGTYILCISSALFDSLSPSLCSEYLCFSPHFFFQYASNLNWIFRENLRLWIHYTPLCATAVPYGRGYMSSASISQSFATTWMPFCILQPQRQG